MNKENKFYVAFFDAEFTAKTAKDRGIPEMIQCAFLVYEVSEYNDEKYIISDLPSYIYTTFVKPIYTKTLSEYIKQLTGISQKKVDQGQSFKKTIDDIYALVNKYEIRTIVTWGPDRGMLRKNLGYVDYDRKKSRCVLNLFQDISFDVSVSYGYDVPMSQSYFCEKLGIKEDGEHHCHHHEDGEDCHCHHHECDENDGNEHSECEHGHCKHHHCHCHNHGEEEYGISTFVYYRRKPIVRSKFRSFVSEMPKNIIRTKGIMWFSNDNENMYIFEQAGVQKSSFRADVWIDTLPEEQKKYYIGEIEQERTRTMYFKELFEQKDRQITTYLLPGANEPEKNQRKGIFNLFKR